MFTSSPFILMMCEEAVPAHMVPPGLWQVQLILDGRIPRLSSLARRIQFLSGSGNLCQQFPSRVLILFDCQGVIRDEAIADDPGVRIPSGLSKPRNSAAVPVSINPGPDDPNPLQCQRVTFLPLNSVISVQQYRCNSKPDFHATHRIPFPSRSMAVTESKAMPELSH
jgi:hypothetical protein